jgi:hypothetical protein
MRTCHLRRILGSESPDLALFAFWPATALGANAGIFWQTPRAMSAHDRTWTTKVDVVRRASETAATRARTCNSELDINVRDADTAM